MGYKRILYCDLIAYGGIHSEFNSAFLKVLMLAYSNISSVEFFSAKEHGRICSSHFVQDEVNWHFCKLLPDNFVGGIKTPLRDLISCLYVLKLFFLSKKDDIMFFSLAYPFAQYCIYIMQGFFHRNVFLCQHGELESLINDSGFARNKYYYSMIRPLLKLSRVKTIILGKPVFDNVKELFYPNKKVIVVDHPYDFFNRNLISNTNFSPLVLGQIGTGGISKGTQYLFKIAYLLKNEILAGLLKIKLVGCLPNSLKYLDNGLVEYSVNRLNAVDFKRGIEELNYTLQLRDNSHGKAVASGSFWDTIKYEKPFFSLRNSYIEFYTQKYPNIGRFYDTVEDLAISIKKMIYNKESLIRKYDYSISEIYKMQKDFSLESIALSFKSQDSVL